MLFQVGVVIAALLAISNIYKKIFTKQLDKISGMFWVLFWLVVITVTAWPNFTSTLAKFFGIGRGVDLGMYIAIAALFYLLFKTQVKLEQLNRHITMLVRKDSVDNPKKK